MTHLDEATMVALRDGDLTAGYPLEHLRDCDACADEMKEASGRSHAIAEALASLDEPVDALRARAAVRRRLDARRGEQGGSRAWLRGHVGRAAALLALTAGAASALPWSPVRQWWAGAPVETTAEPDPEPVVGAVSQGAPVAGISVAVPEGRIAVIVTGTEAGTVIDVRWVERATARVSAPSGSGFTYADGRAEVEAAPGPIEVQLPREADAASLVVDGRLFLERSGARLEVPGPAVERTAEGIRFVVPAP
jgi:hypothetical protein